MVNILSPIASVALADEITVPPSAEVIPSPEPSGTPAPSVEPSPTVSPSEIPAPTPEPTLEPSPTPPALEPALIDTSTTENQSSATLAPPIWQTNSDGSVTTTNAVTLNTTYKAPQNDKVTVTFTKLPDQPGKLTIKEISTSTLSANNLNPVTSTAYDITSDMSNGTFEYTLTLPTPTTQNVEIKASEDGKTFVTLGNVTVQTDTLTITSLNHFTLFVVVGTISNPPSIATATVFDESSAQVLINEFVFNGSPEWVELYNRGGTDVNLSGWTLVDAAGSVIGLTGIIPAGGFVVFENIRWLNNGGIETINLKNGSTLVDQVSYKNGTVVGEQNIGNVLAGQSVARTVDGGNSFFVDATPTKGWSNQLSAPTTVFVNDDYIGLKIGSSNQPFTSIQEGINAVASGGTVNVVAGTYTLDSQIRITKGINIIGVGDSTIITKGVTPWTNTTGSEGLAPIITILSGSKAVTLENLKVTGAATILMTPSCIISSCKDYGHGINVVSSSNVTLNNVTSVNNAAAGLVVNNSTVTVNNITTANNGLYGINVDKGSIANPASLTVNGVSSHSEIIGPAILIEDITKNVLVDANSQYSFVDGLAGNLRIYNLKSMVNPTIDLGTFVGGIGTMTATITITNGNVNVEIPAGTVVTSTDTNWNGVLTLPTATTMPTIIPESGNTATGVMAIEVGTGDTAITFSQPVKLTFVGQAGNLVGWSRAGVFTPITAPCDSLTTPTLVDDADCKIVDGADLLVWTKHFTTFVTYTQTAIPAPVSSSGGGGGDGGDGLGCATHDCSVKPATPSQGQVLGVSTKLAGLGLAFAPGTEPGVLGTSTTPSQEKPTPTPNKEGVKGVAASPKPTNVASESGKNIGLVVALGILILASSTAFFFRKTFF